MGAINRGFLFCSILISTRREGERERAANRGQKEDLRLFFRGEMTHLCDAIYGIYREDYHQTKRLVFSFRSVGLVYGVYGPVVLSVRASGSLLYMDAHDVTRLYFQRAAIV